jgi:two-component system phosphate regulon sensor histidine kinase PhoR
MLAEDAPVESALAVAREDRWLAEKLPELERLARRQDTLRQKIEREEFSLKMVLSSMAEGVIVVDARHKIRLANSAFIRGFGLSSPPVERTVLEVLGEPDVHRLIVEALDKREPRERQLEMIPGKRIRFIEVRAVPMGEENGRSSVLAVFRDVSRLQELEQVRREFVANVSHELRTPLAIFQGYVENLVEMPDLPASDRSEIYGVLMKHSGRLNALVEDLLALARLEARKEQFSWSILHPEALIREVVGDWQMRSGGEAVQVEVQAMGELPTVRVDRRRIEQVLHNLLDNAYKHVPKANGKVVVRMVNEERRGVRVVVEDNGTGISPRDLPHIFERFYRGDKSRGPVLSRGMEHSTGLGLSIAKHIIAAHGGEVGAESPYGSGARVWFSLPPYIES